MHPRQACLAAIVLLGLAATPAAFPAGREPIDRALSARAGPAARAGLERALADPALRRVGRVTHLDERYALPTMLWAAGERDRDRPAAGRRAATPGTSAAASQAATAARGHLGRVAPFYRLDRTDVLDATQSRVHDTGRGGVIVSFARIVDGIEVFRDEMKVMMDRDHELVAVSGFLPGRALLGRGPARSFRLSAAEATARALEDLTGLGIGAGFLRDLPGARGGYQAFDLATPITGFLPSQPLRAKPVWFHLPEALVPAWYVETLGQEEAYAYVIAAGDGDVLFRHDLVASDVYSYRVWADPSAPFVPWDGPQGTSHSPHPTGTPDLYGAGFSAPVLVSLQNGPISTDDPWLPPGATETVGNNVDAYADTDVPDGYNGLDLRAPLTGPATFDHTYDVNQEPWSAAQRRAAVTQLFYTTNFLHDWFYDAGFDEASGNAQASNYGRGGVEGDRLRAEAQDYSGTNNANMSTPADGGQPRMQMYVWNRAAATLTVSAPAPIAGGYHAGPAGFGPQTFGLSGTLVAAVDGAGPASDACTPLVNAVAGMIVLIDRSSCGFVTPVTNAQAAGAIGAIIVDNFSYGNPPTLGGGVGVTIPVVTVTVATGSLLKAHLGGAVSVTMNRATALWRDGTIDNQIIAHEWGHYISNRLIGNGGGLSSLQGGGMGEGWADFHALLLTARAGDDFDGVYPVAGYAISSTTAATNVHYYGIRRYPYSTDMSKDPLTFKHIQTGVPLPVGPLVAFGADGSVNAAVHRTGEVWCSMLWECYAALLNDSGRLTFAEAQQRMRDYLVAGYKMTPNAPTFTEARDALLAAAAAGDPADLAAFWAAFAKRGAGTGAVSPDRASLDNVGVTESFVVGGDLAITAASFGTTIQACDADAYVDNGEVGELALTIRNIGASVLSATSATITSTHPAVSFPNGNVVALSATDPFASASATVTVALGGAGPVSVLDFQVEVDNPGLLVAGPRLASAHAYGHADEGLSATDESFETATDVWTPTGDAAPAIGWSRREYGPTDHRLFAFDPGVTSDAAAMSPPLVIGGLGPFRLQFQHAYRLEDTFDGGVLEISTNDGATWADIGGSITIGGYTGTIVPGSAISGRAAWTGTSPGYPALTPVTVDLGMAYAGQSVRVRFRAVTDGGVGDEGWSIASLSVEDNQAPAFPTLIGEPDPCGAVAVADEARPAELSFALAGENPVRGIARFRFALPAGSDVELAIHDVAGRRVAEIARGRYEAGVHAIEWVPQAGGGRRAAGLYFARLTAGGRALDRRLIVLD